MNSTDAMLKFCERYTEMILTYPNREIRNISVAPICKGMVQVAITLDGGDVIFLDIDLPADIPLVPDILNAIAKVYSNAAHTISAAIARDVPQYAGRQTAH